LGHDERAEAFLMERREKLGFTRGGHRFGEVLLLGAWFGLLTGLAEGAGLLLAERFGFLSRNAALAGVSAELLWAAPVFDFLVFVALGGVLGLISLGGVNFSPRVPLFLFSLLMFFDWLMLADRVHWVGALFLSIGLTTVLVRWLGGSGQAGFQFCRRTLPLLAALVLLAAVLVQGGAKWREWRETNRLPKPTPNSPNVLIVMMDTLRPDHLSSYGYERRTSPNLDELARQGVLFEQAFATSSWTLPSHASILTGQYPHEHGAETARYDGRYPTLPEVLRDRGYRTAAFSANLFWFTRQRGFGRGFLRFEDSFQSAADVALHTVYGRLYKSWVWPHFSDGNIPARRLASDINESFLAWLGNDRSRPFFAFLNYFEPHGPYLPPQPFRHRFSKKENPGGELHGILKGHRQHLSPEQLQGEIDAYDGAIAYMDHAFGKLLARLRLQGLDKDTIIVVTSDHGDGFEEHELVGHRANLYSELIRAALVVRWPQKIPQGLRVARPVSNAWIAATLEDLLQVHLKTFPGPSLAEAWKEPDEEANWPYPIQQLAQMNSFREIDHVPAYYGAMTSVVTPEWHYIVHEKFGEELYDWPQDPQEQQDLAETQQGAEIANELSSYLTQELAQANRPDHEDPTGSEPQ